MYVWLENEIELIKTSKFHLVDGPIEEKDAEFVRQSELYVPPSYKEFVIRFGYTKLYRHLQGNRYLIEIFPVPQESTTKKGERIFIIGKLESGHVCFKESLLEEDSESPVFEMYGPHFGLVKRADSFSKWLKKKYDAAKKKYKKVEWKKIVEGPAPFKEHEKAIVEARREYKWKVIGVSKGGDIKFEVYNGSERRLLFLTVGIRRKQGGDIGWVFLPVSDIQPRQTKIIEQDCYKNYLKPEEVEAYGMPLPGPEDREIYWEFKEQK